MQYPHGARLFARSPPRFGVPGQAPPGRLVLTVWSVKIFGSGPPLPLPRRRSTAANWLQAHRDNAAAPVVLASTHQRALEVVPLEVLKSYSVDVPADAAALDE